MDELDVFRDFCPEPGDPPVGHREDVVRSLDAPGPPRSRKDRSRRRGGLVGGAAALIAVFLAAAIVVHQTSRPDSTDAPELTAVDADLDGTLAFVSDGGWDVRRVRAEVRRSDGTDEPVESMQIANYPLPTGGGGRSDWSTDAPTPTGDQVLITVLRVGPTPPDTVPATGVHRGLPIQVAADELPNNLGGKTAISTQVWLEYEGISYRIDIATNANDDAAMIVNRGLAGLRASRPGLSAIRLDENVEYVAPSGWNARLLRMPDTPGTPGRGEIASIQTGNYALPPQTPGDSAGASLMEALTGDQVYVNIFLLGPTPRNRIGDASLRTDLPVRLVATDFGGYSGMVQETHARVSLDFRGTSYLIDVESKRDVAYTMAQANRALVGLRAIDPASRRP